MTATATPETTTALVAEFSVHAGNLERALKIAQLCASKDKTLPILNAVAMTVSDAGNLVVQSTDRFTLMVAAVAPSGEHHSNVEALRAEPAVIPTAALSPLFAWLKPRKAFPASLALRVEVLPAGRHGQQMVVTDPTDETTHMITLVDGDYPKIGKLMREWKPQDLAADRVALNPEYLERMAKAGKLGNGRNIPMEVCLGGTENKPVMFRGRDGELVWEGLMMPVRLAEQLKDTTRL